MYLRRKTCGRPNEKALPKNRNRHRNNGKHSSISENFVKKSIRTNKSILKKSKWKLNLTKILYGAGTKANCLLKYLPTTELDILIRGNESCQDPGHWRVSLAFREKTSYKLFGFLNAKFLLPL